MARIVLIIENAEDRHLVNAFLSAYPSVGEHPSGQALDEPFDLCIIDAPNLNRMKSELEARREAEQPGILPVLLVTPRRDIWTRMPHLWQLVDDSITTPANKLEFQARTEILLRARRISLELKLRNEDLEAFVQAMSHDLRASLRTVTMFTEAILQSDAGGMTEKAKQDLDRVAAAAQEMRELI